MKTARGDDEGSVSRKNSQIGSSLLHAVTTKSTNSELRLLHPFNQKDTVYTHTHTHTREHDWHVHTPVRKSFGFSRTCFFFCFFTPHLFLFSSGMVGKTGLFAVCVALLMCSLRNWLHSSGMNTRQVIFFLSTHQHQDPHHCRQHCDWTSSWAEYCLTCHLPPLFLRNKELSGFFFCVCVSVCHRAYTPICAWCWGCRQCCSFTLHHFRIFNSSFLVYRHRRKAVNIYFCWWCLPSRSLWVTVSDVSCYITLKKKKAQSLLESHYSPPEALCYGMTQIFTLIGISIRHELCL